jgi:2-dehydropantoate 2-reductase
MRWKHRKLLSNLGNALQILIGPDLSGSEIADRLIAEAKDVYATVGIDADIRDHEKSWLEGSFQVRPIPGMDEDLGGSSWQSVLRGGSIETDFLNGEIARLARTAGGAAPVNSAIQRLVRRIVATGESVGSMTSAEIESELQIR